MPSQEMEPFSGGAWEVPLVSFTQSSSWARPHLENRELPRSRSLTLEDIQAKLAAAAQRREMLKRRGREPSTAVAAAANQIGGAAGGDAKRRLLLLEERLAGAEANRQQRLAAVVARAARRHADLHSRAAALKERQARLAARLDAHLRQAEAARGQRLAQTAARAGLTVSRAREAAAEARAREEAEAAAARRRLLHRLERAERSRQEAVQAMLAGQARHGGAGEGYLPRQATRRAQLRRQSSSRRLQAAWRAFSEQRQTTRALAAAFAATGVPFTMPLAQQSDQEEARTGGASAAAAPPPFGGPSAASAGPSADPTPFGTPDPCSSPTSTLRRLDGRLASAPVSITQTPHSTPTPTPAPSAAASPTSLALRGLGAAAAAAAAGQASQAGAEGGGQGEMGPGEGEGQGGTPRASPTMLARSPSQSPVKKLPRSSGRYSGTESGAGGGGAAAGPDPAAGLSRASSAASSLSSSSSSAMSASFGGSSSALAAALEQGCLAAVDMDAELATRGANLALAWHLLYNPAWQLPSEDLEAAWRDALGETDPLTEQAPGASPSSASRGAAASASASASASPGGSQAEREAAAAGDAGGAEALRAAVGRRVRRLAERAFWDGVQEKLAGGGGAAAAAEQAAGLLAELGAQLGEVLPGSCPEAEEVAARLDPHLLLQELLGGGAGGAGRADGTGSTGSTTGTASMNVPALLGLLDWSASLVARMGAPARDAAAAAARAAVQAQLADDGTGGTAAAATRALRLLSVQLKLLRLDAANVRLRLLAAQLAPAGAAAYAATKLEEMLGPAEGAAREQLGARLPHARAWLAAASGQLPQVEQLAGLHPPGPGAAVAEEARQAQALPALRAGLRSAPGGDASPGGAVGRQLLTAPVAAASWRGLVRLGLVQLVSGEGAVARLPLPETLRLDTPRLHAAQAEFQRLLVLAACLMLVRQGAAAAGKAFGVSQAAAAKRRLGALLADPAMRLPDLAAEVARLAGGEAGAARERAAQESISRLLSRGGGAMKALTAGLSSALLAPLLLGPGGAADRHSALSLRRCGAADVAGEAAELARQLAAVAAVTEAVCGAWYAALSADLL